MSVRGESVVEPSSVDDRVRIDVEHEEVGMLGFIGTAESAGDEIEMSFSRPPLSERSGKPMLLAFGDDDTGPLMGLFFDAPCAPVTSTTHLI